MTDAKRSLRTVLFTVAPEIVTFIDTFMRERGHKLIGVVTAPGPVVRRTEEYREVARQARPGLDMIISNYPSRWAAMIRPWKPDLMVCVGFNWKIPADVLDLPRLGAYNMHDALLPRNRGRNSVGWALRTGEPVFGVTFHRMTPEFDDGPILSQRPVEIAEDDDIDTLMPRFFQTIGEAHEEAFERAIAGYPGVEQDESQATYTGGAFEPEWREIDWNKPARDVHFQIRSWCGVRGVPRGAFGEVDGKRLLITKAKPVYGTTEANGASPGTVLSRDNGELLIQCSDGPLRIMKWESVQPQS